jgi:hypothetical protein
MKTKRYNANGYVTSDDSNSGMKEKYDEDEAERQVTAARSSNLDPAVRSSESVGNSMKSTLDRQIDSASMDKKASVKMPTRPGQASSGRKTPIVTEKQLGDMELRDYLNKQRGLKRRGESNQPTSAGDPKLNSMRERKPRNFDPAFGSSEIIAQKRQESLNRQIDSDKAEKKAAATAKSQEIIDRMAKRTRPYMKDEAGGDMKRGGAVKKMASGGSTASRRGDGIAQRGKTKGKMC